jgi:precorrin-2/cobalt-factor-2 C20-methyltransferase
LKGILYGVGTGPGDPELMTLKAVRVIKECSVIAVPASDPEECMAYNTACGAYPETAGKEILKVPFLMGGTEEERIERREANAAKIAEVLDEGTDVAFLTIGDPLIYTTFGYAAAILKNRGYDIEIVNGVPSFCAAASRIGTMLCSGSEGLEIIPGSEEPPEKTRVFMKNESELPPLLDRLRSEDSDVSIVENCCLESERVFRDINSLPDDIGYFNIIIAKDKNDET